MSNVGLLNCASVKGPYRPRGRMVSDETVTQRPNFG